MLLPGQSSSGAKMTPDQAERLREGIRGLALYAVVGEGSEARDVRNRNVMDKPRLLDAVLLDHLWELVDELERGEDA